MFTTKIIKIIKLYIQYTQFQKSQLVVIMVYFHTDYWYNLISSIRMILSSGCNLHSPQVCTWWISSCSWSGCQNILNMSIILLGTSLSVLACPFKVKPLRWKITDNKNKKYFVKLSWKCFFEIATSLLRLAANFSLHLEAYRVNINMSKYR